MTTTPQYTNSSAQSLPLISVLVPVYNIEHYLDKCLGSLVGQSYTNLEIVVVNDGSTDSSGVIIEKYASSDGRFKVVDKANEGLTAARRDGLRASSGEFVFFIDGDDYISPHCIERLYGALQGGDCDMASAFRVRVKEGYASLGGGHGEGLIGRDDYLRRLLRHDVFAYIACKLCRRSVLDNVRFYTGIGMWEDFMLNLQIALAPSFRSVCFVEDAFYFYIQRPGSMIRAQDKFDYIVMFEDTVDEVLAAHGVMDGGLGLDIIAERVMRYGIYIKKGRNPWRGDSPHFQAVRSAVSYNRKELRCIVPPSAVRDVLLYGRRRHKGLINFLGTFRRWGQSLRRRTTQRISLGSLEGRG